MAIERLTAVGWGLVSFGIVIGLGVLVIQKFGDQLVTCAADKTWNVSTQLCQNATGTAAGSGTGYTTTNYVITQMGTAGLAGWIPVIIVVLVAGLIFMYFGMNKSTY